MKIKQNKLGTYLAVTVGAGCAVSVAEGAVTFYGVNSANDTNSDPVGISVGPEISGYSIDALGSDASVVSWRLGYFTAGVNLSSLGRGSKGEYSNSSIPFAEGSQAGDQNYANISFDGDDGDYEAVGQFFFDSLGGGYLIAIATINDQPNPQDLSGVGGPTLSISQGKAMIDAAAVPEPSSLALLALGATGLATRRNRKKAA